MNVRFPNREVRGPGFFVARNREEAASDKTAIMEGNLFSEAFSFGVRSAVSYRESSARCSS